MPRPSFLRALALSAFVFALVASVSSLARAQNIAIINAGSLPRLDSAGKETRKRSLNLTPEGINQADCLADQKIRFPLTLTGYEANGHYEVWASTSADCSQLEQRTSTTARLCWQLSPGIVPGIPLQPNPIVDIPVRAIMAGAPPFTAVQPADPADASMCGKVELIDINVQFLYIPPASQNASGKAVAAIKVDTVGPSPPSGVRALPGNKRIKVEWNSISGGGGDEDGGTTTGSGGLTALTGLRVYCDKATDTVPTEPVCEEVPNVPEAGTDGDAGEEDAGTHEECTDGGTQEVQCGATSLTDVATRQNHVCGSITGNTGTSMYTNSDLENGVRYAVAVAATDQFDNAGDLSTIVCETPDLTTDFWDDYRNAGGAAGGGCTTSGGEVPFGSAAAIGTCIALAISSFTRRRNRR